LSFFGGRRESFDSHHHGLPRVHVLIDPLLACSTLDLYSSFLRSQFRLSRSCSSCYAEEPTPDTGTREKEKEREREEKEREREKVR